MLKVPRGSQLRRVEPKTGPVSDSAAVIVANSLTRHTIRDARSPVTPV
jgi:hypothetical protein